MKMNATLAAAVLAAFALSPAALAGENAEKGGTEDINIGVGELHEDEQQQITKRAKKEQKKAEKKKKKEEKMAKKKAKKKKRADKKDDSEARATSQGNAETTFKVEKASD